MALQDFRPPEWATQRENLLWVFEKQPFGLWWRGMTHIRFQLRCDRIVTVFQLNTWKKLPQREWVTGLLWDIYSSSVASLENGSRSAQINTDAQTACIMLQYETVPRLFHLWQDLSLKTHFYWHIQFIQIYFFHLWRLQIWNEICDIFRLSSYTVFEIVDSSREVCIRFHNWMHV